MALRYNGGEYSCGRDSFDNDYFIFIHGRRLVISSSSSRECSSNIHGDRCIISSISSRECSSRLGYK